MKITIGTNSNTTTKLRMKTTFEKISTNIPKTTIDLNIKTTIKLNTKSTI